MQALKRIAIFCFFLSLAQPVSFSVPSRVVSTNLCTDELLLRLAPHESIAALSRYSDNPVSSPVFDEARDFFKTGADIEEILALNPDLVIATVFTNRETVAMLKRLKIPTVVLNVPADFEGIYENLRILGNALGREEKAKEIISHMRTTLTALKRNASEEPLRAVFYQSAGNVPGTKTFQDSIMRQVGFTNLAEELEFEGHRRVQLEELVFARPEILILVDAHLERTTVRGEHLFHPALKKGLPNAQVMKLPSKYMHCGAPSSIKAVSLLNKKIEEMNRE